MPLPISVLRTAEVAVAGTIVQIRSLNRREAISINNIKDDLDAVEVLMLTAATGQSVTEVQAFRESSDPQTVETLMEAIGRLSGISSLTPLRCPECGHEDEPSAFVQKDEVGDPKSPPSRASSSEPS